MIILNVIVQQFNKFISTFPLTEQPFRLQALLFRDDGTVENFQVETPIDDVSAIIVIGANGKRRRGRRRRGSTVDGVVLHLGHHGGIVHDGELLQRRKVIEMGYFSEVLELVFGER